MKLDEIYKDKIESVKAAIKNDRLHHAYLIVGTEGMGKFELAESLARLILCEDNTACGVCVSCHNFQSHADRLLVPWEEPDEGITQIGIDEVRSFLKSLSKSPYISKYKVGIISNAQRLTEEAANSLLKTLEEPTATTVIILTAEYKKSLPETIASRCQIIWLRPVADRKLTQWLGGSSNQELLLKLALGKPGHLQKMAADNSFLEKRLQMRMKVLDLTKMRLAERFQYVNQIEDNETGEFLESILAVLRDALLVYSGQPALMANLNDDYVRKLQQLSVNKGRQWLEDNITGTYQFLHKVRSNANKSLILEAAVMEL